MPTLTEVGKNFINVYSQLGDKMILRRRSDGKDPKPMFSFVLRKNTANENRVFGTAILIMTDDDTEELEEREIPHKARHGDNRVRYRRQFE